MASKANTTRRKLQILVKSKEELSNSQKYVKMEKSASGEEKTPAPEETQQRLDHDTAGMSWREIDSRPFKSLRP